MPASTLLAICTGKCPGEIELSFLQLVQIGGIVELQVEHRSVMFSRSDQHRGFRLVDEVVRIVWMQPDRYLGPHPRNTQEIQRGKNGKWKRFHLEFNAEVQRFRANDFRVGFSACQSAEAKGKGGATPVLLFRHRLQTNRNQKSAWVAAATQAKGICAV